MNIKYLSLLIAVALGAFTLNHYLEGGLHFSDLFTSKVRAEASESQNLSDSVPRSSAAPLSYDMQHSINQTRRNAIVTATELAQPSVVSISVSRAQIVRLRNPFFDDPFFDYFGTQYRRREVSSLGSGVILNNTGHIVTNSHVLGDGPAKDITKIVVNLSDGRQLEGKLIGRDPNNDLAVLQVKAENLPEARTGDASDNLIGEWVIAIGNPFGYLISDAKPTVTVGVISALNRSFQPSSGIHYHNMIQTDASINPGNSGGALVNADGNVIGINTFIFTGGGASQGSIGIGFAIPIQKAKLVVKELIKYGYIREFTTGIYTDPSLDEVIGNQSGIVISGLVPNSPGEKAGLKVGDVLVSVAGRMVANLQDVMEIFKLFQVGEAVELEFARNQQRKKTKIILEEKPRQSSREN